MFSRRMRHVLIGVAVLLAVILTALALFEMTAAAQSGNQRRLQLEQGGKLYVQHCASCHGPDATGNGPLAVALKSLPTDLTRIKKEDGKFPTERLQSSITGEYLVRVHGTRDMPVWGGIIGRRDITLLVKYIESIQKPF